MKRNLDTITGVIAALPAGTLLVLPEGALSGYDSELSGLGDLAPEELLAARSEVSGAVARSDVHLLCGTLLYEDSRWWSAAVYFSSVGGTWIYRKVNLAGHERGRLAAGAALPVLRLALPSGEARVGVQLCRELRFPEQWHCLGRRGAQLLAHLSNAANPAMPAGVWRAHLISRAAEMQRFVIAANVAHADQHSPSMIVSPRGEVLPEAVTGVEAVLHLDLELSSIRDEYLRQQRDDVVSVNYRGLD